MAGYDKAIALYEEIRNNKASIMKVMESESYKEFESLKNQTFAEFEKAQYCEISIGPGWWELAVTALRQINEQKPIKIRQIKEKFGALRIYYSGGPDMDIGVNPTSKAESASVHICEVCGAPGELGGSSWIRTRCEKHAT